MRKFTVLSFFAICAILVNAQTNLVVNPSFESWTDGKPDSWTFNSVTGYTATSDATIVLDGNSSIKFDVPSTASGTPSISQSISLTSGKTYTLSLSYYVASGDGTDARVWANFKTGTTYFAEADLVATGLYSKLRGPGNESSSGSAYFTGTIGQWNTYTVDFTVPSNADGFDFQVRPYRGAVVYWDKFSLVEKTGESGIANNAGSIKSIFASGNTLVYKDAVDGTPATLYNAVGKKIKTLTIENGEASLSGLAKGLYIVRAGTATGKVLVK